MTPLNALPGQDATLTVSQDEAARLAGVSAKTLGRLADRGEPVGRMKICRRVVYLRTVFEAWLASKLETGGRP